MPRTKGEEPARKGAGTLEGLMAGFARLVERLEEVSEEGKERLATGTFDTGSKRMKGVYGVSVKIGAGGHDFKVEPFGNVRRDRTTGEPVVEEVREPLVDVFEEEGGVMVVTEMPGIDAEDVRLELAGTRLTLTAERGERKYHKELDVPAGVTADGADVRGRNGIVEITLHRRSHG